MATTGRLGSECAAPTVASGPTMIAQAGIDVVFETIVNLSNVFEIAITLFGKLFGTIKCLILIHINDAASTYPGVRVNLPRIWGRLTQVKRCHKSYNTQNTTKGPPNDIFNAYVCK